MSNGLTFEISDFNIIFLPLLGFEQKMDCAKFQGNRSRFDGEIGENHAIPV